MLHKIETIEKEIKESASPAKINKLLGMTSRMLFIRGIQCA